MPEGTLTISPTVGANAQLSVFVLDPEDLIMEITKSLLGVVKRVVIDGDGKPYIKEEYRPRARPYTPEALSWFQGRVRGVLSKNTFLSNAIDIEDMKNIQWCECKSFLIEMLVLDDTLGIDLEQELELQNKFMTILDLGLRRALYQGDKTFLTKTTSEQTQRLQQNITQESENKGFWGMFKGGK